MKIPRRAAGLILLLLGLVLCTLGSFAVSGDWSVLLVSVGAALLAVVVISLVWWWVGGDPAQSGVEALQASVQTMEARLEGLPEEFTHRIGGLSDLQSMGIIKSTRTNAQLSEGDFWSRNHHGCRRQVDLCGRAMLGWFKQDNGASFERAVLDNLSAGCTYRILVYRPYAPSDARRSSSFAGDITEHRPPKIAVDHSWEALLRLVKLRDTVIAQDAAFAKQFMIKTLRPYVMPILISRFDDIVVAVPYAAHTTSANCPHFVVSKGAPGSLADWLEDEFVALWNVGVDLAGDEEILAQMNTWFGTE